MREKKQKPTYLTSPTKKVKGKKEGKKKKNWTTTRKITNKLWLKILPIWGIRIVEFKSFTPQNNQEDPQAALFVNCFGNAP